jgi:FkbM family methyltransferase
VGGSPNQKRSPGSAARPNVMRLVRAIQSSLQERVSLWAGLVGAGGHQRGRDGSMIRIAQSLFDLVRRAANSCICRAGPYFTRFEQVVQERKLVRLRRRMFANRKYRGGVEPCFGYTVQFTDSRDFYIQYKDQFIRCIYSFDAQRVNPVILDGGSNIGMSILAFKRRYPHARIVGFEPDPYIFKILRRNMTENDIHDVRLVNAGLGMQSGTANFKQDYSSGGQCQQDAASAGALVVKVERLSDYLNEPVDFLKLNIEGDELSVLTEAANAGKLRNIRELVVEYHGWPNTEQSLGAVLKLLDQQGFRYLVHDFDAETCSATKPPFRLTATTTWFCLVYAERWDG